MQSADLPARARAFVQHYFDGKPLPVALGRLGRLTSVGLGRSDRAGGREMTGRVELRIEPQAGSAFTLYAEPRSDAPHLAHTGALNISYVAPEGTDDRRFVKISRALAGYFSRVESMRGRPDSDDLFGPPGDPLERAANDLSARNKRIEAIVFPTDACNLRCSYCIVPFGKNILSGAHIDRIFELLQKAEPESVGIGFLGGEPMLHWPTIKTVSERFAAWWPSPQLSIVTNGTFCKEEHAAFFAEHNFNITVSVDGGRDSHIRHRVNQGAANATEDDRLFDKTMAAIDRLVAVNANLHGNMVVTPDTVGDLTENAKHLWDKGLGILTISPAVGVRWGDAVWQLKDQLAEWGEAMRNRIPTLSEAERRTMRGVIQWETRRAWYFLGNGRFNPTTRRLCFAPDGRIFSDLYNDDTADVLHLGHVDELDGLCDLPDGETSVPQAMFQVQAWDEPVLCDVRRISTLLMNELIRLDATAFTDEPGVAELDGQLLTEPLPIPEG
jgi:sulfatase maturation enzyme AslB (radical SAM superfamily)